MNTHYLLSSMIVLSELPFNRPAQPVKLRPSCANTSRSARSCLRTDLAFGTSAPCCGPGRRLASHSYRRAEVVQRPIANSETELYSDSAPDAALPIADNVAKLQQRCAEKEAQVSLSSNVGISI